MGRAAHGHKRRRYSGRAAGPGQPRQLWQQPGWCPRMAFAPKFGFIGGAIQLQQGHIDGFLLDGIPTDQGVGNFIIDVFNSLENALARVACFIAIAQFKSFMDPG